MIITASSYMMLTATPGSPFSSAPAPESPNSLQDEAEEADENLWTTERYYSFLTGHNEWKEISEEEARKKQRTDCEISSASIPVLAADSFADDAETAETVALTETVDESAKQPVKSPKKNKRDAQISTDATANIHWTSTEVVACFVFLQ